jgi:hypothetical protein
MAYRLHRFRAICFTAFIMVSIGFPGICFADNTNDTVKAAARSLGEQGLAAMDEGDFVRAADLLNRAYRVHQVPSLALWSGRVLVKLGRFVAAAERFREASRLGTTVGDNERQAEAKKEAAVELTQILPRIAAVTIKVPIAVSESATLLVDNSSVSTAILGTPIPMDPGDHEVVLRGDGEERRVTFRIDEGETKTVNLTSNKRPEVVSQSKPFKTQTATEVTSAEEPVSHVNSTVGWVLVGLGAAGFVTASVTGVLAFNERRDLVDSCKNYVCPPEQQSSLDQFRMMRTLSTISWVAGAVSVGVGATFLLTAPKPKDAKHARAALYTWIGANSLGIGGSY